MVNTDPLARFDNPDYFKATILGTLAGFDTPAEGVYDQGMTNTESTPARTTITITEGHKKYIATYNPSHFNDSEALHEFLTLIATGTSYTVRFRRATKAEKFAAQWLPFYVHEQWESSDLPKAVHMTVSPNGTAGRW